MNKFLSSDTASSISIIFDSYADKWFVNNQSKEEGLIAILTKGEGVLNAENVKDNLDILVSSSQIETENVLCDTLRALRNASTDQNEEDCIVDLIEMLRQDINSKSDFMKTFDENDCSDIKTVEEELN